ncbi:serine/threonine-protein kinase ssp1 [Purpureocillium lavendulum]|uniref:Serine/threonine-protein kinase ssp1 n=1 Tax=Purpureocillium lavendulum TaxID=1247861 RepID=A0AB34FJA6_9HYPO|nr:serine/threonine-protein kinase ssp1 [Purpureocillium lavendulum]
MDTSHQRESRQQPPPLSHQTSPPPVHVDNALSVALPTPVSDKPVLIAGSPHLHPLQTHRVRETHKASTDPGVTTSTTNSDITRHPKSINQYEVVEKIYGNVKLARNIDTGENVVVHVVPQFSKKRRLGGVGALSASDKTRKEIAILKKIRHPNIVGLLEVIDDPELKSVYLVLEDVDLGDIVWRKKGLPVICQYERRRFETGTQGETLTAVKEQDDKKYRQALKQLEGATMARNFLDQDGQWGGGNNAADDPGSGAGLFPHISWSTRPRDDDGDLPPRGSYNVSPTPPDPATPPSPVSITTELDVIATTAPGDTTQIKDGLHRRPPSMLESIISHNPSVDWNARGNDLFAEEYSFVPCLTFDQVRSVFRDTVLGLEYLHYQGIMHRNINPANLLWSKDHRVRISGVATSYFGPPIRDGSLGETVAELEAKDIDNEVELARVVGTPTFLAPELCYTDPREQEQLMVSDPIDIWSLGVTLFCLIYARVPFLAEDEFQMAKKIATEDVHISRKRLKPVNPSTSLATPMRSRQSAHPYRDDNDFAYEDVDNLLYDLLRQMLAKDPNKRISLRDIKRHPWVVQGVPNVVRWLDETEPSRRSHGKKIQVDGKDMSLAIVPLVPLNSLEKARAAMKESRNKVVHPLAGANDGRTRRRATGRTAVSTTNNGKGTAPYGQSRNDRREHGRRVRDDHSEAEASEKASNETLGRDPLHVPSKSTRENPNPSNDTSIYTLGEASGRTESPQRQAAASTVRYPTSPTKHEFAQKCIRKAVLDYIEACERGSIQGSSGQFKAKFDVDWDPLPFIKEQEYALSADEALKTAITLTGDITDAQDDVRIFDLRCAISFQVNAPGVGSNELPGCCWHDMFSNPVIVTGFPILVKHQLGSGIEMPLNMIAALVGSCRINRFDGKIYIKGFSAFVIATRIQGDSLIWHYVSQDAGQRISYHDHNLAYFDDISLSYVNQGFVRHVVGWCSDFQYFAGSSNARYEISRSQLPQPPAGCLLEKVTITAGHFISVGATIGLALKDVPPRLKRGDDPLRLKQKNYILTLKWIATKYVVLWDEGDKCGWLVNGTSALLHLVRAWLEHSRSDDFSTTFVFDSTKMQETDDYGPTSAAEILANSVNMGLEIYPGKREVLVEQGQNLSSGSCSIAKASTSFLFENLVEKLCDILEMIIDYQRTAGQGGVKIKATTRKHLEGWDFTDLATDCDPKPKFTTIGPRGYGWVDLVHSIGAIALFGRGFGDIIKPKESHAMCRKWVRLPKGNYYLAASALDLDKIERTFGRRTQGAVELVDGLLCEPGSSGLPKADKHIDYPPNRLWHEV